MRAILAGLCITAALLLVGCGEDEATSTTTGDPSTAIDDGCSAAHPQRLTTEFDGFVVMCDDGVDGASVTIQNISRTVIVRAISPSDQTWTTPSFGATSQLSFVQGQVKAQVKATCDTSACVVPPGTTLSIEATEQVRGDLSIDQGASVAAAVAYTGLDALNKRLGTPGQRLIQQADSCFQATTGLSDGGSSTAEWTRRALGLSSCRTLYQQLVNEGTEPAGADATKLLPRVKRMLGASYEDVATLLVRIAHP